MVSEERWREDDDLLPLQGYHNAMPFLLGATE